KTSLLRPFHDPVAQNVAAAEARIGRNAGLALQLFKERLLLRDRFPDLRKKSPAASFIFDDQAVFAGANLLQEMGLVGKADRLRRRKERHLDATARPFGGRQWRKARIPMRGG